MSLDPPDDRATPEHEDSPHGAPGGASGNTSGGGGGGPRLFCEAMPHPRLADASVTLDEDQSRHARRVLRLGAGRAVELFDGRGTTGRAVIARYTGGRAVCEVRSIEHTPPPTPHLHVAAAIPKGPRAEDMVNQLGQLGVDRLTPLRSARAVVRPRSCKLQRFAAASVAAAKQSRRAHLMRIDPLTPLDTVLAQPGDVNLMLTPGGGDAERPGGRIAQAQRVVLLIGPEGGWTEQELAAGDRARFQRWRISPHVLRIETAATAAASIARYLAQALPDPGER